MILFVDDEKLLANLGREMLEILNYHVISVTDAKIEASCCREDSLGRPLAVPIKEYLSKLVDPGGDQDKRREIIASFAAILYGGCQLGGCRTV